MRARNLLTLFWVRGITPGPWGMANIGELGGRGRREAMLWKAARGHKGDAPKEGIWTVANCDCFWMVLDHLRIRVAKDE